MSVGYRDLPSDSPGTQRRLACHRFGRPGARPKVYLQAALHADEMPGVLTLQHLMDHLDGIDANGRIKGEIVVVPLANPIGLGQWVQHKPQGRQDLASMQNFNRGYPDLAALASDEIAPKLSPDPLANVAVIRAAFGLALDREWAAARTELQAQRIALLLWSHDADHVLDLHCDHHAILHLYTSPAQPETAALLARSIGAKLALIQDISGGNAFDEAHSAPWLLLRRHFGDRFPIPDACFATTLELRGQFDVDETTAEADARGLLAFLTGVGAVESQMKPLFDDAPQHPLGGSVECFAPQGAVVSWQTAPGDWVTEGQAIGHVTDPMTRLRLPVTSPATGLLFRQELWRSCLKGQGLAHISGAEIRADASFLSD
jgi:uncharacterized protein